MADRAGKPKTRRQVEAERVDSQAQLSAVLDTVGEGIITIDSESTIVMVNREVESIWGYAHDELVGNRLHMLMPEEYRTRHSAGLKRYLETGAARAMGQRLQLEGLRKDGSIFPLEIRMAETQVGQRLLFTAAVRDITDRLEAERALQEANSKLEEKVEERALELQRKQAQLVQSEKMAALGQLLAGVAHEINTPLGALSSNIDIFARALDRIGEALADMETAETAPQHEKLKRLLQSAQQLSAVNRTATERITAIVGSLRRFARLDESELNGVDIHEGIDNTLTLVQHELKHRVQVEKDYGEVPLITCYPNQLNQVFMNLLVNASHAIEGKGTIFIKTRMDGDSVTIEFRDTGIGIPEENRQRIFDPGFTTKEFGEGTGLGLSIVSGIVQNHKGRLEVESQMGKGSTFRLILPGSGIDE